MKQDLILAIDNGTQSVRALVFDLHGKLVAKSQVMIDPYFSRQPGWAEQDPAYYWQSLCRACQELWQQGTVDKAALAGVTVTTQRGTMINVDRQGEPLRPAIVWLDQRRTHGLKPVGGLWGVILKLVRMDETVAYFQAESEINWLRTRQPDLWKQTHKYLMLSGYLTYRLTGRFVDSVGAQVGYLPFDYKKLAWAARSDWKWQAMPMNRALLPDLVSPATPLGKITPAAAQATGIPAGLPLIAAAADKACEALGAGSVSPQICCLSYGTTATVSVTQAKYREVRPFIPPFPAALPGA
jgi:sugar (pentulose or hexulose) kinase